MDFKNFLNSCGIDDPEILISFLEAFSEDFDVSSLSSKDRERLEKAMDRVLEQIST